ncbi:hypothetical protein NA57DRAFT_61699 [Rhizodiscina lignyota]|uniref:F-box domain-containing protein n=1 Tax=Rhizodiscina lignyota TaxID=1504668 RepID=A0A9P4I3S3_9PEZI|nr:hypothetical protein NA57DRAFT_61699 [Rhizodiscina lignyota]
MADTTKQSLYKFLTLPLELRQQIYDFAILSEFPALSKMSHCDEWSSAINIFRTTYDTMNALRLTCRQVRAELPRSVELRHSLISARLPHQTWTTPKTKDGFKKHWMEMHFTLYNHCVSCPQKETCTKELVRPTVREYVMHINKEAAALRAKYTP